MKNTHIKVKILKNIRKRRFYHNMRVKLKAKLCRGGKVNKVILKKYKLKNCNKFETIGTLYKQNIPIFEINIPEIFSFIEAPKETQSFFRKLKGKLNHKYPYSLQIIHSRCKTIDLAASFIFDKIIKEEISYWQKYRVKIELSGLISEVSKKVNNFLLSFGLLSKLGLLNHNFGEKEIDFDYNHKYYHVSFKGSKLQGYKKSLASVSLVDYFDNCFKHNHLEIVKDTKLDLMNKIGEIIGNAEEHSGGKNGEWYALGCYDKDAKECSFAIINFGKSIYETLSDKNSTAADVIEKITEVIDSNRKIHEKIGLSFDKYQEEPLWTVMALQDGISSKRTSTGQGRTHGHGIMDVLTFIGAVKDDANGAKVCICSGHSSVLIDYAYYGLFGTQFRSNAAPNQKKNEDNIELFILLFSTSLGLDTFDGCG